jgi:hypothetical protein
LSNQKMTKYDKHDRPAPVRWTYLFGVLETSFEVGNQNGILVGVVGMDVIKVAFPEGLNANSLPLLEWSTCRGGFQSFHHHAHFGTDTVVGMSPT